MNLTVDRDSDFRTNQIQGVSSNSNIMIEKFSGNSSNATIGSTQSPRLFQDMMPERKTKFIPPQLSSKKVPMESFGSLANSRKMSSSPTVSSSGSDDSDDSSEEENFSTMSSQNQSPSPYKNRYASSGDEDSDSSSSSDDMMSGDDATQSSESGSGRSYSDSDSETIATYEQPRKSYEEIQKEKQQILFELDRLQKQGFPPSKKYTMASQYEDMVYERDKLKKQRDTEKSIKFSRKALMMVVSGIEFLNGKFDPFDVKLDGWSEKVMEDITDYDEIFEELHEKYGESVKTAPELRLLLTLAGSGFMFHLTNSLFKSAAPDLNDILKKNPDIMRNIQEAAARNMQQNINQQMGSNDPIGNMMKQGIQMKMGAQGPPVPQQTRVPPRSGMPMGPSRPLGPQPTMRGPNGVDELLKEMGGGGGGMRDEDSMSESSVTMRSFGKRGAVRKTKKGGIELDLT